MSAVNDFLENIDEQDLRAAVAEIKQVHATGILPDGVVRRLTRGLVDRTRIPTAEARDVVEKAVLRMAAFRWAGV
ncbi:hypothetical protein PQH03_28215 [Ralstonia insidiosa]|jgi:hypothetical protein|uniref:Uncharacterized protein n=2 Tax=Ralstonia TaxID=48736 RepID=A0A192A776_9RALS|nr:MULTISPECIES: hypothetical protein [Ralstonia]KMW44893.1 hypothetical protein AC240_23345 [Ralstonia sp. MD27]ANJ76244.1 hypothetical protein A9Y76_26920 [Ralstonia insidiosa]MBA9846778.1 hypothetical protein [Ralstonia pickettii]MBA9852070.1 hypothetical protein [Ralstonia pickettii]MBA9869569.1 hypothetical protein [Ralstonia insidiosa]